MSGYYTDRDEVDSSSLSARDESLFEADTRALACALIAAEPGDVDAKQVASDAVVLALALHAARCKHYEAIYRGEVR